MSGVSAADDYHPGLEGVIANETAIANIEGTDGAGGLEYRGYRIEDLAGHVSYEETAFLLLHGDLPTRAQLSEFDSRLRRSRAIPEPLVALYGQIPSNVHPMDVLRSSVSVLAHFDPDCNASPLIMPPTSARPSGCSPRWPRPSRFASGSSSACP